MMLYLMLLFSKQLSRIGYGVQVDLKTHRRCVVHHSPQSVQRLLSGRRFRLPYRSESPFNVALVDLFDFHVTYSRQDIEPKRRVPTPSFSVIF